MGWKSFTIVVKTDKQIDERDFIKKLGFSNAKFIGEEYFESAIYPDSDKFYIGTCNGSLVICHEELSVESIMSDETSFIEDVLSDYFPDSEIGALVLHSVVNFWGYSISKNKQKIRVRSGSADDGVITDFGEPLPEETALLLKAKLNANNEREYFFEDFPDDPFTEDQVGENFVFAVSERFFGESLDASEIIFDTKMRAYKV